MSETFRATLVREAGVGTWTYVAVPPETAARLGTAARIPVVAEVEGVSFTGSVMTGREQSRYLVVNRSVRDQAGVAEGDTVSVRLRVDTAERRVEAPDDLTEALAGVPAARRTYEGLSYSRQKEYVTWLEAAKRPETRQRRLAKALDLLAEGRALKG
ncbi:YdeI/OmpD-associated family protein [Streptomyces sp. NPDC032161]|uniref:YdeI/OmpD-associated family protein n=1 Tax=unclassified Streptomyces TaxID=2593676 RepID=UPI00340D7C74